MKLSVTLFSYLILHTFSHYTEKCWASFSRRNYLNNSANHLYNYSSLLLTSFRGLGLKTSQHSPELSMASTSTYTPSIIVCLRTFRKQNKHKLMTKAPKRAVCKQLDSKPTSDPVVNLEMEQKLATSGAKTWGQKCKSRNLHQPPRAHSRRGSNLIWLNERHPIIVAGYFTAWCIKEVTFASLIS